MQHVTKAYDVKVPSTSGVTTSSVIQPSDV